MNTRTLVINAVIAAVYAALTIALAPLSYEWDSSAPVGVYDAPGICGSPLGSRADCRLSARQSRQPPAVDIVIRTLATCIAVYGMRYTKIFFVAALLPVANNGIIIALELAYLGMICRRN